MDGTYLFLILIFAVIPTIILYFLAAGALTLLLRPLLGGKRAAIGAMLVLTVIAFGVPFALNHAAAVPAPPTLPDLLPSARIRLSGNVLIGDLAKFATSTDRLSLPENNRHRRINNLISCGELCVVLLATKGVETVTSIYDDGFASTYAVSTVPGCTIVPTSDLRMEGMVWWAKRATCLDKRPNVGRPDVSIEPVGKSELIADVYPAPRLKAPRVSSKVTIVRGANGDVQLRVTEPRLIAIFTPLSFCWSLDLQDNAGLCARETSAVPNAERHSHLELLADHTTLYDARKIRQ